MEPSEFKYVCVIVTFNRKEKLVDSVYSLLDQSVVPRKVVIIDNHSTDNTMGYLEDNGVLKNPIIDYFQLDKNIGGSGGFYEGLRRAVSLNLDFDWISVSDDDAVFDRDFFRNVSSSYQPNILAYTGSVRLEDGRLQVSHRRRVTNYNYLHEKFVDERQYDRNFMIDIASFVGLVVSRSVVKKIGLPRKDFFIWYDDIEYSLRIREYTKILNVVNAEITHKTEVPSNDYHSQYTPDWREYYGIRNRLITLRLHTRNHVITFFYICYSFLSLSVKGLGAKYAKHRVHFLKVVFCAYWDALWGKMGKNKRFMP
ncbi:glycosyltransferase [Lactiplantibacillus plantarum]|uniref:glycosyltransferase n=1 Tax=Lactobacillaceae TaxID=33958 RepID=UPI0013005208|nr:glycosyltransferase [Levilactobacillus brevis]MBX6947951.1 glycosyltransferase [Levilactobacillus brevis]MDM5046824.1 glycosyltransferase [Levilactobacillus brevis]